MSADKEAPWAAAWREWTTLASKGFKPGPSAHPFEPRGASASGFAEAYLAFARGIQEMLKQGGGQEFASRFVQALQSAAQAGVGPAANDDFLNAFLRAVPNALLSAFPDAHAGQAWRHWSTTVMGWADELLALPAVGPQREWQEMVKAVQRAVLAETQARAVIDEHYRLATRAALQDFAGYLKADSGPSITTVRALYDAWIDHAEAAYARRVMGEDFARDFAAWVNAGSEVRLALRGVGGRLSAVFDAPGRDEIDTLLERQQAMQRELAALRAERVLARGNAHAPASVLVSVPELTVSDTPVVKTPPRAVSKKPVPVAKTSSPKTANPPRDRAPRMARSKPLRGEFDIGHILDAGK